MTLFFRPHHFLCAVGFQGKGYSNRFVENFTSIVERLRSLEGDNIEIKVTFQTDTICHPCPHRQGHLCNQQTKIEGLDQAHARTLNLQHGDTLTWGTAKKRIVEKIPDSVFHRICEGCSWKSSGLCANALIDLRSRFKCS